MKNIMFFILFFFLCGCSPKLTETAGIKRQSLLPENVPEVYIVADNQFHIIDGRAYPLLNYLADKATGVAVRPPQTTVFGPYAYEAFLEGLNQSSMLIYLGDASDVSCPQELNRFFTAMEKYNGPWLFVPGNHDGFYTGNSQYKSTNTNEWDEACIGHRLNKSDAIETYLFRRFGKKIDRSLNGKVIEEGNWCRDHFNGKYFAVIDTDADSAQRSFIIQQVRFETAQQQNIRIIILDTCQYKDPPKYRNILMEGPKIAGITGEILRDQMLKAEEWFAESQKAGDLLYIAGHHPLKEYHTSKKGLAWKRGSKWLKKIMHTYRGRGYISAHTHIGGTRKIWKDKEEWNVASFVDWPLGFRAVWVKNGDPEIIEVLFDDEITPQGIFGTCSENVRWKPGNTEFHYYTAYRNEKRTGPTGRYMQHYLLIAELKSIVDALNSLKWDDRYSNIILQEKKFIKAAEYRFNKRIGVKSESEIEILRRRVKEMMDVFNQFKVSAPPSKQSLINKYCWCQLWWAAKEDAQRQWGEGDVTGKREKKWH